MKRTLTLVMLIGTATLSHAQEVCGNSVDENNNGLQNCADLEANCDCSNAFPCSELSELYQLNQGLELREFDYNTSTWNVVPGHSNGIELNAMGYNVQTGYMYAMKYNQNNRNRLYRVDRSTVVDMGTMNNVPTTNSFVTGDFDISGHYYIAYPAATVAHRITFSPTGSVTNNGTAINLDFTGTSLTTLSLADWAFSVQSGKFHGVSTSQPDMMVTVGFSGTTGDVSQQPISPPLTCGAAFGAAFADNTGRIFVYCNESGALFALTPNSGYTAWTSEVLMESGTPMTLNDGASCPFSVMPTIPGEEMSCCEEVLAILQGREERSSIDNIPPIEPVAAERQEAAISQPMDAVLHQNKPNPFSVKTTISYEIHKTDVTAGQIIIYNMSGVQLKRVPIAIQPIGQITIEGNSLPPGMYMYTLILDDKEIDTKRMILVD